MMMAVGALLASVQAVGSAAAASDDHAVVGRFSISSEAGGAVWAFQPSGLLVLTGPGDIMSEGSWVAAVGADEFDASIGYAIAGQELQVQGAVSPDGSQVAVYVRATEPTRPDDAEPWPIESRLTGERVGMTPEASPSPSPLPPDCTRPQWLDGDVDWDRCDVTHVEDGQG